MKFDENLKTIYLYTDGACSGNPGPGGYGAILKFGANEKELSAGYKMTTNNRMELMAAIAGLEALREPCNVELYSDSKYLVDSISKGWLYGWQKKNWVKSDKKKVLNVDLWQRLLCLMSVHNVNVNWVKGHNDHPENERCDRLAVEAYGKDDLLIDEYE